MASPPTSSPTTPASAAKSSSATPTSTPMTLTASASTPTSDVKAKAEARRAKILARESSRLSLAQGNIASLEEDGDDVKKISKERPLASRRNLIQATDEASGDISASAAPAGSGDATSPTEGVKVMFTPKIVQEVEQEVAENTRKFDEEMLSKGPTKGKASTKGDSKEDTNAEKSEKVVVKKGKLPKEPSPIQAFQVMQLIRLFAIVLLAASTGYQSALTSRANVVRSMSLYEDSGDSLGQTMHFDSLEAFVQSSHVNHAVGLEQQQQQLSSWSGVLGWIQRRFVTQTQSSVSAVALVWWVTSMLSTAVNRLFPHKPKSSGGLLEMVMSLYNLGLQTVLEYVYRAVGEIGLHALVLLFTAYIVTILNNNNNSFSTATIARDSNSFAQEL